MTGETEVSFFGKTYDTYARDLAEDAVVTIKARARERGEGGCSSRPSSVRAQPQRLKDTTPVAITLPASRVTPPLVDEVKEILRAHPGTVEVRMVLTGGDKPLTMRLGDEFRVTSRRRLYGDLKAALGPNCLTL